MTLEQRTVISDYIDERRRLLPWPNLVSACAAALSHIDALAAEVERLRMERDILAARLRELEWRPTASATTLEVSVPPANSALSPKADA